MNRYFREFWTANNHTQSCTTLLVKGNVNEQHNVVSLCVHQNNTTGKRKEGEGGKGNSGQYQAQVRVLSIWNSLPLLWERKDGAATGEKWQFL